MPPANDNFASAEVWTGTSGSISVDTTGATAETDEAIPTIGPGDGPWQSAWYEYTPITSDTLTIDLSATAAGSDLDTVLAVYTGASVDALTEVGSDDDSGTNGTSRLSVALTSGVTYHIQVSGYDNTQEGLIEGVWAYPEGGGGPTPPANDNFADAEEWTGTSGSISVDTTDSTVESGEPVGSHWFSPPGGVAHRTVWYKYTPPSSGNLTIDLSPTGTFDSTLAVWTGTAVGSLTEVGSDDDSGGGGTSKLTVPVASGVTYHIQIGGYNDSYFGLISGTWLLEAPEPPPDNDDQVDAEVISGSTGMVDGTLVGATSDGPDDDFDVWYKFLPGCDNTWDFTVTPFSLDIYDADTMDPVTPDGSLYALTGGVVYLLRVHWSVFDDLDAFTLTWFIPPVTVDYAYTGADSDPLVIPDGVTTVDIEAFGGGAASRGGADVQATIDVVAGDELVVRAGGKGSFASPPPGSGGWPDGGDGGGTASGETTGPDGSTGGGGSTTVLKNGVPVVIAGGAGTGMDGGQPDGVTPSTSNDGEGGTQTNAGVGGVANNGSSVPQGFDGEDGSGGTGGAGGGGADEKQISTSTDTGSLTPAGVDGTGHYISGSFVTHAVTVPAGCYIVLRALSVSGPGGQLYVRLYTSSTPPTFGSELAVSFRDTTTYFGDGRYDNNTGSDRALYIEIHTAFGPGGALSYSADWTVTRRVIVPGGGGGGGYFGGGGGASELVGTFVTGGGGGGSSWVDPTATGVSYTFDTGPGDGKATITYVPDCPSPPPSTQSWKVGYIGKPVSA